MQALQLFLSFPFFHLFRGKGDYYRLGHGDDSHQRIPKRVMGALATKKVVDIACGSLHCLVCTEDGKVYTWGDNDEGQIGNDNTAAVQAPTVSGNGWSCFLNLCRQFLLCVYVEEVLPRTQAFLLQALLERVKFK